MVLGSRVVHVSDVFLQIYLILELSGTERTLVSHLLGVDREVSSHTVTFLEPLLTS